jgi:hypothetical protein
MKIQFEIWVVTPCSDVVGYQRFGGQFCLHLQGEDGAASYPTTKLHGVTSQNVELTPNISVSRSFSFNRDLSRQIAVITVKTQRFMTQNTRQKFT